MQKIYNTLTRKIELFETIKKKEVSMYVCGPTVYGDIHIGNARPVIFFDMLKRYLIHLGYQVNYVSNITDVDDKIIEKAIHLNQSEKEVTDQYTDAFIQVTNALGSKLPNQMPKATHYIGPMIKYIQKLVESGFAYVKEDGVYFKVQKVKEYGMLSNQNIEALEQSVRIKVKDEKEDPRDFTLWKSTNRGIQYHSPWGEGRPGWHTECAVMNHEIFNGMIDIHGGGSDLKFPHHENEIAQSIAHDQHHLAKYWMHVGRLDINKEKMSKSIGNTILVKELLKTYHPYAFRMLILGHHYRQSINYTDELMLEYEKSYQKIVQTLKKTQLVLAVHEKENTPLLKEDMTLFLEHMQQDLNTPNVMTLIFDLVKRMNKTKELDLLSELYQTTEVILTILGIMPPIHVDEVTKQQYIKWQEARQQQQYDVADQYRNQLVSEGWI